MKLTWQERILQAKMHCPWSCFRCFDDPRHGQIGQPVCKTTFHKCCICALFYAFPCGFQTRLSPQMPCHIWHTQIALHPYASSREHLAYACWWIYDCKLCSDVLHQLKKIMELNYKRITKEMVNGLPNGLCTTRRWTKRLPRSLKILAQIWQTKRWSLWTCLRWLTKSS